jgi:hypothetical protein
MEQPIGGFNLFRFQKHVFPVLLGWALGSIAAGIPWAKNGDNAVAGFGSQFAGWGAINAILALFGLSAANRNLERQVQGAISSVEHDRQAQNFERLVLVNAGLDLGYIAAGSLLARTPASKPQKRTGLLSGMGWGIIVQGTFLLIWDLLLAALVHKRRNA